MIKTNLIVIVMGDNCLNTLDMCFKSVIEADKIIFCWGMNDIKTKEKYDKWKKQYPEKFEIIKNKFEQDKPNMISIQKNFWLEHLKKNYDGWWCIYLDADEVLDNIKPFRDYINKEKQEYNLLSPKMRHLIGNLCTEDATKKTHYVINRFFKISNDLFFPEAEHTIIRDKKGSDTLAFNEGLIWHLGYLGGVWDIKKRYDGQMSRKSETSHPEQFLNAWNKSHLYGNYPTTKFNPIELPDVILNNFGIDKDELYFINRTIELKHSIMVKQWYDYFKPTSVLDLGCGRGCYLYFWKWFIDINKLKGIEISEWACKNMFADRIVCGDISEENCYENKHDLITSIDVLEHLDDEQLDKTLKNMSKYGKRFLFSIPFIGDPNLKADKTHKQFKTKEEWIKLIELYGIKIKKTPQGWLFAPQILVGEKI